MRVDYYYGIEEKQVEDGRGRILQDEAQDTKAIIWKVCLMCPAPVFLFD